MKSAKIELHLHLDGSLNIRWAYDKAIAKNVIDPNTSFEEFYKILYGKNIHHSAESIKKFELVCDVLQDREDLFEATYDLGKRLNDLDVIYAEIRFASQQHCKNGLTQAEALKAVIDGAAKAMEDMPIRIGIINCLMHKGDSASFNQKENLETIEASKLYFGKGLVGLDLAGFENNCEFSEYAPLFEIARKEGIPYTIHAGEMGIGSHILEALAMKPNRIGHGIDCIQDESYIEALLAADMPLEVCVSSNIKTTGNYSAHPIRYMLERGLKVTVNTDNMIFAKSNLVNEHMQLKMLGISEETLRKSTYDSLEAAFCDQETKRYLKEKLDSIYNS
ncbi:MAG: amidohydrolase family protein [Erysipelotrichaceae bacterium]|nr:amidohydrolase family protein [Erysipelotrichaceae bacterium]